MAAISHLPTSSQRLETYIQAQSNDPTCKKILQYCPEGWPHKKEVDEALRPYWEAQEELTVGNGLLMYGKRIVVPTVLQSETLQKLHEGHLGIVRSRLRASISVWWPGLSKQLADYIKKCPECARDSTPNKEPLTPTSLPEYQWQRIATDIFHLKGDDYTW